MPTRWEVEEKVRTSSIEPGGRHILLTLLSLSNAATAEIPSKHLPTFDDLESMTGLARSTLTEWMKALTDSKWIVREVLEGEKRIGMRILVGPPTVHRIMRVRKSKTDDASYRHAVREEGDTPEGPVPPRGTSRTATRYAAVPPRGMPDGPHCLKDFPTESQTLTDPDHAADAARNDGTLGVDFGEPVEPEKLQRKTPVKKKTAPKSGPETHGQKVNRVTKLYTDNVKLVDFHGVRGVVDAAFKSGDYSEEQITTAVKGLAKKRDPITRNSLRIAIEGQPSWADRNANGRRAGNQWQPPENQDEYDKPFSGATQ